MDTFQIGEGNNSTVTTNGRMLEESFYLSEDEDIFGDVKYKEQEVLQLGTSNDKPAKWQTNDDVVDSSQLETSRGEQLQDCHYAFPEPFFTQPENVFDKCVAALHSVEYNTELFEDESNKLLPNTKSVSHKNEALPNSSPSNRITSSDELYAEACKPIERVMYGMDSNLKRKITSASSKVSALSNPKRPLTVLPDEVSMTKITPDNDESKRGVCNEGPLKRNTKTRFQDGRFSAKEHPSDNLGTTSSSVPPSPILALGTDTRTTLNTNVPPTAKTTTTPADKPGPLLNCLPDEQLLKVENVFNLPINLQKPNWVLTVSGRLSKSQNVMVSNLIYIL